MGVLQKCVNSTPNGWSLTRLPNLSGTHLLIIAEVENQSHALQLVLPKILLQTFVERPCPSVSTKGCWEGDLGWYHHPNLDENLENSFLVR